MRSILVSLILLILSTAGTSLAKPYEDAMAAMDIKDYATAVELLRPLAAQGDSKAQVKLGDLSYMGRGVPQSYTQAVKWYRLAADQGYSEAQFALGTMYSNGLGETQDYSRAVEWYRLAADQGFAEAQYALGTMYGNGLGVPISHWEAAKFYHLAASQGMEKAQLTLAGLYSLGKGLPKDYISAYFLINLVAEHSGDSKFRTKALEFREKISEQMSSSQIAEAKSLETDWMPKLADYNNSDPNQENVQSDLLVNVRSIKLDHRNIPKVEVDLKNNSGTTIGMWTVSAMAYDEVGNFLGQGFNNTAVNLSNGWSKTIDIPLYNADHTRIHTVFLKHKIKDSEGKELDRRLSNNCSGKYEF